MSDEHITVGTDSHYDLTVHPAFASACTVTDRKTGQQRKLYEQDRSKPHNCKNGKHPQKHKIVLKGKNGKKRDITITIDDPEHAIASLSFSLYEEGRDPHVEGDWGTVESFSIENAAHTCPPHC